MDSQEHSQELEDKKLFQFSRKCDNILIYTNILGDIMAIIKNHVQITLEELEANVSLFKLEDYIKECEDVFDSYAIQIVEHVRSNPSIRAIFISGPTASGKTTFTHKLSEILQRVDIPTCEVSLDDYYYFQELRTDAYGRPDYESLDILDTELMIKQVKDLFSGETVVVPCFDFSVKKRVAEKSRELTLPANGILLVEGLHGLSKSVSGEIPKEQWHGVFIMPFATLTDDYRLLDKRDIRILRRITRDVLHRGATALATIDYWPMLDQAEESYFPEYLASADVFVNSAMPYEFYCVAPMAHGMIARALNDYFDGSNIDSNFTKYIGFAQIDLALIEAKRLLAATSKIPHIDLNLVPETSILNEFIR